MAYTIQTNITADDFLKFSRLAIKRACQNKDEKTGSIKTALVSFLVWLCIAIIVMSIIQYFGNNKPDFDWFSAAAGALPFIAVLVGTLYNLHNIQKHSIPKKEGAILGEKLLTVSEQGLTEKA